MSKGLGGNIGCRDRTSSWYLVFNIGEEKYIYVLQQVRRDLLPCHLIQYMFAFPTTYSKMLFHRLQRQKNQVVVTMGQQYDVGEKSSVIMYTYYVNRHAGPPNKIKQKTKRRGVVIIKYSSAIESYIFSPITGGCSEGLGVL